MATTYAPLLSFNRGLISKTTLARTDLDRTRLSAEIMTNWLPKTQGPMILRPGTKYVGSSYADTGAQWLEFVASTTDVALVELTSGKMRVWLPSDTDNTWETPVQPGVMVPLARPAVDTTLSFTDTGWSDNSVGGALIGTVTSDLIPTMTAATTSGVTITASSENAGSGDQAWRAANDDLSRQWIDTGVGGSTLPSWWNVDFGSGNTQRVRKYSIRAGNQSGYTDNAPRTWRLLAGNYDTGTYATDTGKWAMEDQRLSETGWAVSEKRTYTLAGSDTGTVEARRHWRLFVTAADGDTELVISEVEFFDIAGDANQAAFQNGTLTLNARARGSIAKAQKRVVVSDTGTEHGLVVHVSRGPVTFRVGSTLGDDDYISETTLSTGYHNLAFVPEGPFYVTVQSDKLVDRIVQSIAIGDSGTVELTTPWSYSNLDDVRADQSADVVYLDCPGVKQRKIERRGTGRSWSIVEYEPDNGPFLSGQTSSAKLGIGAKFGNTTIYSDTPFFRETQVGALFQITHEGQSGQWRLGNTDAKTDIVEVTGISDTGTTPSTTNERRLSFSASGIYTGQITIERSFDGPDFGFKRVTDNFITSGSAVDTGTFTTVIDDDDDNITVFYRARMSSFTSGAATIAASYKNGSVTGTARITNFASNTEAEVEILSNFSDTGSVDTWREGAWSERRGYPSAVALHEGRLFHAGQANVWGSVSDDYENFDDALDGDAGPISRTLGSGPVDAIQFLISLLRLVAGTAGSEIAIKSSSLDEVLTPTNASARAFSTQGSAGLRAIKLDNKGLYVQRSLERLYMCGFGSSPDSISDYESTELTILVPDVLKPGVVSVAVQRQPDTRIHCVLADGTVAILTYEPKEEVLAWSKWVTDTGSNSAVERAMVLPGLVEDAVFYHVRRTINGTTRRYLERWALESECQGDTGLSWLADCAVSYTDTGAAIVIPDFAEHLGGQTVAAWANDTGQNNSVGRDLTPDDTGGAQQLLAIDTGGDLTLNDSGWKHVVAGLPYVADFKSTKLAYGTRGATAMTMMKRVDRVALILNETHNNALFLGSDTGHLDPMPRVTDEGATVDPNKIFAEYDKFAFAFDGDWDEDSRIYIRAKAPRPATVMAILPRLTTNEA